MVDFVIAIANGERGVGAFVEPLVILLILVANGGRAGRGGGGRVGGHGWVLMCWGVCANIVEVGWGRGHQQPRKTRYPQPRLPHVPPPTHKPTPPPAATVGVITENNAEKAIEELKAYEADVATALREASGAAGRRRAACFLQWRGREGRAGLMNRLEGRLGTDCRGLQRLRACQPPSVCQDVSARRRPPPRAGPLDGASGGGAGAR